MRRELPAPTVCRCGAHLVTVIGLDGADRSGCTTCEPDLLRIRFTDTDGTPCPVYLERRPKAQPGDAPPCPRCSRPFQAGWQPCAGCGYPTDAPPKVRRRYRDRIHRRVMRG